jgi:hypothetical protein
MLLDDLVPDWHRREVHRHHAASSPVALLRAVDEVRWSDVPAFRALMTLRAGGRRLPGETVIGGMTAIGFRELARSGDEVVYGAIGRPWSPRGALIPLDETEDRAEFFRRYGEPGWAKMALAIRAADGWLTTETRVYLTDRGARRAFDAYWLVIRPFSGLIRRVWLAAIVKRAAA